MDPDAALQQRQHRLFVGLKRRYAHHRVPAALDLETTHLRQTGQLPVKLGEVGRYALLVKGLMTGTGAGRIPDRVIGYLDVAGQPVTPASKSCSSRKKGWIAKTSPREFAIAK